jgi:hypothetical protein
LLKMHLSTNYHNQAGTTYFIVKRIPFHYYFECRHRFPANAECNYNYRIWLLKFCQSSFLCLMQITRKFVLSITILQHPKRRRKLHILKCQKDKYWHQRIWILFN